MDTARVDDHWKAIRPRAGQIAAKEMLTHRAHGLIDAGELSDRRGEGTGGVDDDRRVDAAGGPARHTPHAAGVLLNANHGVLEVLDTGVTGGRSEAAQHL